MLRWYKRTIPVLVAACYRVSDLKKCGHYGIIEWRLAADLARYATYWKPDQRTSRFECTQSYEQWSQNHFCGHLCNVSTSSHPMGRIANDVAFTQNVLDHRVKGHLMVSTGDDAEKKELTTFIPQGQHMQTIHTGSDQKRRHSWTMVRFLFLW